MAVCFTGCGTQIGEGQTFCSKCNKELPPLPTPPPRDRKGTGKPPRGPTPHAGKQLRMLERDIGDDLLKLRRLRYGTDEHGNLINPEFDTRLAAQYANLAKALVPVAKERRQWLEAAFAKQQKLTPAQQTQIAIDWLCSSNVAEDDKRRAAEAITASLRGARRTA